MPCRSWEPSRAVPRGALPAAALGLRVLVLCAALGAGTVGAQTPRFPFWDPSLPWHRRLDDLLGRLSPAELVLQVRGRRDTPGAPAGHPAQRRCPAGGEGGSDVERPRAPHSAVGHRALQLEHRVSAGRQRGTWMGHGFPAGVGACRRLQVQHRGPVVWDGIL